MSHFRPAARRAIAGIVLVTFTSLVLQPLAVLAQDKPGTRRPVAESGEERFSRLLNETHEILKELAPGAAMPQGPGKPGEKDLRAIGPGLLIEVERAKPLPGVDVGKKVKELRAKTKELLDLEDEVRKGFNATAKHIKDKNLPPEILARHDDAVRAYEARSAEFKALVNAVATAGDSGPALDSALANLGAFMAKYPNQKTHTPTDPNNLPWGSPKPVKRAPYTTPEQFKTSGLFDQLHAEQIAKALKRKPLKLVQAGGLSGIGLPTATLPVTPEPADLAETEDVQLTPAIRDLAASLGNQPVAIYNWVRNNIQFVPSYGSIQGSDMTLQTKRGNAFDTASLLIALMRAANVPARYVYGTIEVPAEQVMNWVGGVTVPEAAQNLMGQGGIPNLGIAEAGRVKWIQLEHVWAEAYVDYVPSRGAVHRQGDTWVPLDGSFKQHDFTGGMDLTSNVPFDAQAFVTQMQQTSTINPQEGWVQNISEASIRHALLNHQTQVTSYVSAQKPDATMGDVLGVQSIIRDEPKVLYGTLPYKTVVTGARFQAVPDNLRWKFRYGLYTDELERAMDMPSIRLERSTPALAGKKITLSFAPASPADQATINSMLPQPHPDGTPILPSELPQTLPAYLIRVIPELRLDGQVVAAGSAIAMGQELVQTAAYRNAATGQWEPGEDNRPIAGEYIATALDLQGISSPQMQALRARLESTKARIDQFQQNPGDPTVVTTLSKEDVAGDLLYGAVLAYFAMIDVAADTAGRANHVRTMRMPSFGNFGTASRLQLFFGVPWQIGFSGVQMDVDRIFGCDVAKSGESQAVPIFRRAIGTAYSAFEHLVPEQLFTDLNDPNRPQAVSAVKALSVAAAQGQKIYMLNSSNVQIHSSVLSQLSIDASIKQEIANGLAAGKEVAVHQAPVNITGFTGVGYTIIDSETGAGAYKISGGANGSSMVIFLGALLAVLMLTLAAIATSGVLLAIGIIAGAIALVIMSIDLLLNGTAADAFAFAGIRMVLTWLVAAAILLAGGWVIVPGFVALALVLATFFAAVAFIAFLVRMLFSRVYRREDVRLAAPSLWLPERFLAC